MHQRSLRALNARQNMQLQKDGRNNKTSINYKTSVASLENPDFDMKNSLSTKDFEFKN